MQSMLLKRLLWPFVEVRRGERIKTSLMALYFFLVIALVYILKPVRNALFLGELGAENLRYVYMAEGFFLFGIVWTYVRLSRRMSKHLLQSSVLIFFIACLLIFWGFFKLHVPFLSALFYVWVSSFSITMTTQFWTLANDLYHPGEAKRLFGLIISTGSLGGITGGFLAGQTGQWFKTETLLLIAAGVLFLCLTMLQGLWKTIPAAMSSGEEPGKKDEASPEPKSGRKLLLSSTYLLWLAGLVMMAKIGSTVVDNHFSQMVELFVHGKEARTAFFGHFSASLNTISFLMQFLLTGYALRQWGLGPSLLLLPAGLTACALGSLIHPVLGMAVAFKMTDGSLSYSIQQAAKEVLYLPLSSAARHRVKPIIDMLGFRAAKSLGGFYIFAATTFFGLPAGKLEWLVLGLMPLWLLGVWRIRTGYIRMLKKQVMGGSDAAYVPAATSEALSFIYREKDIERLKPYLEDRSVQARKLAAMACLILLRHGGQYELARSEMERLTGAQTEEKPEGAARDIRDIENQILTTRGAGAKLDPQLAKDWTQRLEKILNDAGRPFDERKRAIELLELAGGKEAIRLLPAALAASGDHGLRLVMAAALKRLHRIHPEQSLERAVLKAEILREAALGIKLAGAVLLHEQKRSTGTAADPLNVFLRALKDESLERLFFMLEALYPQEIMDIVHARMAGRAAQDPARMRAVELLSQVLEPAIFKILQPVLEDSVTAPEDTAALIRDLTGSTDAWFRLAGSVLQPEPPTIS